MDVTCERCGAEYEFDDALVSSRGTTVKCTGCGFQFKVRSPEGGGAEAWVVRTVDGSLVQFGALRELQQAIGKGSITREDVLLRKGARPRRLGSIAELEAFFAASASARDLSASEEPTASFRLPLPNPPPKPPVSADTPAPGSGPPAAFRSARPLPPPPPRAPSKAPPVAPPEAAERGRETLLGVGEAVETPAPPLGMVKPAAPAAAARLAASTAKPSAPPPPPPGPRTTPAPTTLAASMEGARESLLSSGPASLSASFEEAYAEPRISGPIASRRGGARWIAGLVLVGTVVLGVMALVRRAGDTKAASAPASAANQDRLASLVADAERRLSDGDLEGAKEAYDKASGIDESAARVAVGLARLGVLRADWAWLRVRLVADGDVDARRELEGAVDRATKALARAEAAAAGDPSVATARLDLRRMQGDLDGARKLVGALPPAGGQADVAVSLAALDLAEASPNYATVLERLRGAVAQEQGLGRARALLVYALARSGDVAQAKTELDRLAGLSRPHPLVGALRAYLGRDAGKPEAKTKDAKGGKSPAEAGSAAASGAPKPKREGGGRASGAGFEPGGRVPDDYVAPTQGVGVDTSDLPSSGAEPRHAPAAKPPSGGPPPSPTVDTSDLPGFKQ